MLFGWINDTASLPVQVMAQDDTTTTPPPSDVGEPGVCVANSALLADTSADSEDDEDEDDGDDGDSGSAAGATPTYIPPKFRCENGPRRVSYLHRF